MEPERREPAPAGGGDNNAAAAGNTRLDDNELRANLDALTARKKNMGWGALACLAGAVIFFFADIWPLSIPALIAALAFWLMKSSASARMIGLIKQNAVRDALEAVFSDIEYNPRGCFPRHIISGAGLVDGWDHCSGSDYVKALYKGHRIEFSDIHLEREETTTDSDGHTQTHYVTVFRGQWISCQLDKQLPAMVRVREKAERRGIAKKMFGSHVNRKSDVETENLAFNTQFQILTNDPHTAFYVLTPHFMEYILAADQQANGLTNLCFAGEAVYIAVHNNRDSFEIGRKAATTKDLPALRRRFQAETRYITAILDELFQNDHLFKGTENA
ncbi:MAG: DUF3137 domain-containing protein [Oscillospiraceae bacterium]|nr:DUF3137 domain-containing protein [Oscillospiraceae bacterium]